MLWYEIVVIILLIAFFSGLFIRYINKRIKHLPTSECGCCQMAKKNALIKAYHKKYGSK